MEFKSFDVIVNYLGALWVLPIYHWRVGPGAVMTNQVNLTN
jgi:hypothetical protein